jgi:LPS export ABC transporter protein LptC
MMRGRQASSRKVLRARAQFVAVIVLVLGLLIGFIVEEGEDPTKDATNRNEPDLFLLNAKISQFNERGHLKSVIEAHRFTHYPLTDVTALESPQVELYLTLDHTPWTIEASSGRLLPLSAYRKEAVELWTDVRANRRHKDGSETLIETDALTVFVSSNLVEGNEPVRISTKNSITLAPLMRAWLDSGQFELRSDGSTQVSTQFFDVPMDVEASNHRDPSV